MLDPLASFGLRTARRRSERSIPGSPERCASRSVLEDDSGRCWLLERLASGQVPRRMALAATLAALRARFPEQDKALIPVYRKTPQRDFVARIAGFPWQLSPFVPSDPLPRPAYLNDAPRGADLARCMLLLRSAAQELPAESLRELRAAQADLPPGLPEYARNLLATTRDREPGAHAALRKLLPLLEPVLRGYADLPVRLQHGDLHPLNALWRGQRVIALIDWEFLHPRPECWDLANLLGCLGFERPDGLTGPLALALTRELRAADYLDEATWALLPEFTALLRLAWLSEWLRKDERDLLDMELVYLGLLLERGDELRAAWSGGGGTKTRA